MHEQDESEIDSMMQEMEEDEIARGNLKMPEDLQDDDSALDDYDDEEEGEGVFG